MKRIYILIIMSMAASSWAWTNEISNLQTNSFTNAPFFLNFEQRFVSQAAIGNLQEIQLGHLAQTNSQNTNVQNFGGLLVMDHSAAQAQLQTIATNLGITLPSTNARTQAIVNQFSTLTGSQFDNAFIPFMIGSHILDIQRYESGALRAPDTAVRDYARTNLPVLTDHLVIGLTIREMLLTNQPAFAGATGIVSGTLGGLVGTNFPGGSTFGTNANGGM